MKKRFLALVIVIVAALLFVSACNGDDNQGGQVDQGDQGNQVNEGEQVEQRNPVRLIMATGGVAGTYYPFCSVMAGVINNHSNYINVTVNASGASADNIQQIGLGNAHIAIAQNDVMSYAFYGTSIWSERPTVTNFGTLMSLYPESVQIVVLADSDIHSVDDLAGRNVSIGDIGSGVEANSLQVLAAHGLTVDDINVQNLGFAPSADAMRDGRLDAVFLTTAAPNTAVAELATARNLRLLSISDEVAEQLMADYPFYVRVTLDSSDYTFLTEPVYTIAVQATLMGSLDLADEVAYDIVRILIDNQSEVAEGHNRGHDISLEYAVQSVSVDFHPGARRFFEERGVL